MQQASYILTWRDDEDAHSRDNLFAVLAWLARYPEFKPIVIEQDAAPRLEGALPHPDCVHFFAFNPGPFNRSWGLNIGFRISRRPLFAFADADAILGDALAEALERLDRGHKAVSPCRRWIDLDETESARVRGGDFDWVPGRDAHPAAADAGEAGNAAAISTALLIEREAFVLTGGWDERFREAGGEAQALDCQLRRAQIPVVELDSRPALRLGAWQPAAGASAHHPIRQQLLADYQRMDEGQLVRLAEIQMQLVGNNNKYRPQ